MSKPAFPPPQREMDNELMMPDLAKLKEIAAASSTEAALAILDKAPDTPPLPTDVVEAGNP